MDNNLWSMFAERYPLLQLATIRHLDSLKEGMTLTIDGRVYSHTALALSAQISSFAVEAYEQQALDALKHQLLDGLYVRCCENLFGSAPLMAGVLVLQPRFEKLKFFVGAKRRFEMARNVAPYDASEVIINLPPSPVLDSKVFVCRPSLFAIYNPQLYIDMPHYEHSLDAYVITARFSAWLVFPVGEARMI